MPFEYEFMGPLGTTFCTIAVPVTLYLLTLASNTGGSLTLMPLRSPGWPVGTEVFSWTGFAVVYGWVALQLALHTILPAKRRFGVVEPDGSQWPYRLNGTLQRKASAH